MEGGCIYSSAISMSNSLKLCKVFYMHTTRGFVDLRHLSRSSPNRPPPTHTPLFFSWTWILKVPFQRFTFSILPRLLLFLLPVLNMPYMASMDVKQTTKKHCLLFICGTQVFLWMEQRSTWLGTRPTEKRMSVFVITLAFSVHSTSFLFLYILFPR